MGGCWPALPDHKEGAITILDVRRVFILAPGTGLAAAQYGSAQVLGALRACAPK